MKIGLVSPASLPATQFGGILFLMLDIAREASNLGHDVTIYTTDLDFANNPHTFNKNLPKKEKIDNFHIIRSHVWFHIQLFFVNPGIYFQMMHDNNDIIHTIGLRSFQSFVAAIVARKKNIPLIISDQGGLTTHPDLIGNSVLQKLLYRLQSPFIKFIIRQASKIIVANEYEKQIFLDNRLSLDNTKKISIIKNGVNISSFTTDTLNFKEKYNIDVPFILFLGRFAKVKGIDILLNSIKIIKNTNLSNKIKFVIMGVDFGFQKQMFDIIKKFNLEDIVCVIKNPSRNDVIAAYRETEFLVLPSRWELSPLTPLEGFVFKKSVISTNVHGIPSTISNGENCVLVENEDFKNLAIQIMKLVDNPDECTRLGQAGYELVQNECNSKSMTEKILKVYNKLINR
tara:strand:- start:594 stop:1790 length:1197 start_codon:yes stop_codon:yes gene_type:complete